MLSPKTTALLLALAAASACRTAAAPQPDHASWNATLRASHILPIAPSSTDIIPGDIFLIHESIEAQRERWQDESRIALGPQVARLQSTNYLDFYADVLVDDRATGLRLPADWSQCEPAFGEAPGAAFPAINFALEHGLGLPIDAPLTAIPAGMDILRVRHATASVMLHAHTYGVDLVSLDAQVRAWAEDNREWLTSRAPWAVPVGSTAASTDNDSEPRYELKRSTLRVVARVFIASQATIVLQSTDPITSEPQVLRKVQQPGGAIVIQSIAPRSITIGEQFDPPLMLGCFCIDMEIGFDGALGPSICTLDLLRGDEVPRAALNRRRTTPKTQPPAQKIARR